MVMARILILYHNKQYIIISEFVIMRIYCILKLLVIDSVISVKQDL